MSDGKTVVVAGSWAHRRKKKGGAGLQWATAPARAAAFALPEKIVSLKEQTQKAGPRLEVGGLRT